MIYSLLILALLLSLCPFLVAFDFISIIFHRKHFFNEWMLRFLEVVTVLFFPLIYLNVIDAGKNDCCGDTATFSPGHKLTIYAFLAISVINYFYSSTKKTVNSPILEVLTNSILLFSITLYIFIAIQVREGSFYVVPIIMLFFGQLVVNQRKLVVFMEDNLTNSYRRLEMIAWKILRLDAFLRLPLLFVLCVPLLAVITGVLLLFGQKPDSAIRAFTDTYHQGLSQLNHMCDNVVCGGHFLCSVAANGHSSVVKPIRFGTRGGGKIICNRQLLVSNAFEELIAERLPNMHKIIRRNYNKVGDMIHKHYHVFNNKFVADAIYILMKPLELFFIMVLYLCDQKPENRIARQYTGGRE